MSESNIFSFFVISFLLCCNHTGSSWDHWLSSFTDRTLFLPYNIFATILQSKPYFEKLSGLISCVPVLHCVSIVSPLCLRTLVENTMSLQRHETWNWKSIRMLFILGCLCCCHSVIHLWAKISLISLCGRDFQNVPTPKTDQCADCTTSTSCRTLSDRLLSLGCFFFSCTD